MEETNTPTQADPPRLYVDNTRISTFFKCPRSFYLRHIRGWTTEEVRIPLIFGSGIHRAMDEIWNAQHDSVEQQVEAGYTAFTQEWTDRGQPLKGPILDAKRNLGTALGIIDAYVHEYHVWLKQIEVLEVEKPFAIYLATIDGTEVWYIGRWDKTYMQNSQVFVGEHKTSSLYRKVGGFAREWRESFSPDSQIDGYQYAGVGAYGSAFAGVTVDGILVHKTHRIFTRVPVMRSIPNLRSWLWNTTYWVNEILENRKIIEEQDLSGFPFMPAYPQRTEQCQHKYGMCGFLNVCKYARPNLTQVSDPPDGYVVKPWDPFTHNVAEGEEPMWIDSRKEGFGDEEAVPRS